MSTSIVKLFVYEAVKCEGINVDYLRRDLPVNNSAIMVKWKCLKLLYSSKGMCRIDSQLKIIEIFNSWKNLYHFLYIQLVFYSFTHLTSYHLCFQVLTITNIPFLTFPAFPFLCFFLQFQKRKYFKIFLALI